MARRQYGGIWKSRTNSRVPVSMPNSHVGVVPPNPPSNWVPPNYTIIAGGYPLQTVDKCVPCDFVPDLIKRARSFDGVDYGLHHDCHWFIREMMLLVDYADDGDTNTCPAIP
jgi:hypothetical protein